MDTKPLLLSTTLQGAIVVVVGLLFQWFNVPVVQGELEAVITAAIQIIGIVMVVIGRYKSQTSISGIWK